MWAVIFLLIALLPWGVVLSGPPTSPLHPSAALTVTQPPPRRVLLLLLLQNSAGCRVAVLWTSLSASAWLFPCFSRPALPRRLPFPPTGSHAHCSSRLAVVAFQASRRSFCKLWWMESSTWKARDDQININPRSDQMNGTEPPPLRASAVQDENFGRYWRLKRVCARVMLRSFSDVNW